MKPTFRFAAVLIIFLLVIIGFAKIASASGPIAVFALVDKVTLEPDGDRAQRILIYGVFSSATNTNNANIYSDPQRGYLCFSLPTLASPTQSSELALREWSDLQSVAGTRQVVAFGSAWLGKVRVRKTSSDAENDPDVYTLNFGVKKLDAGQVNAKALLDYKDR
jgi:hypothetical protein